MDLTAILQRLHDALYALGSWAISDVTHTAIVALGAVVAYVIFRFSVKIFMALLPIALAVLLGYVVWYLVLPDIYGS